MIHTVYLIHQLSGVCIIYKNYGKISFNEDLIAGFLTALKDFSQEVTGGQGTIKVLDMVVYNIHLVFQSGILIAAASDKRDDRNIVANSLDALMKEFLNDFGSMVETWNGDVRVFKPFEAKIDSILKTGKVAEIPREYPILELYEKDYKKEMKNLSKGLDLKADPKEIVKKQTLDWKNKRMPQAVISQGYLSKDEYDIAHMCDGFNDYEEIAEAVGKTEDSIKATVKKLVGLKMVKIIKS